MTIDVRTKGIPMKDGTKVDAEGYHVFSLDEAKHNPFDVLERLEAKAQSIYGVPPRDLERDARLRAVKTAIALRCPHATCQSVERCKQMRSCAALKE